MKNDARVIKTKNKLLTAFKSLAEEKEFEDITVNEICERACIRRATFYKHYADKYDFLKYYVHSLRDEFDKSFRTKNAYTTTEYYVEYVKAITDFLTENEHIVKNALKSDLLPTLIDIVKEQNYVDTAKRLHEGVKHGMTLPASVEVTAAMLTGAVAHVLLTWYQKGKPLPPEELTAEISAVIRAIQSGKA